MKHGRLAAMALLIGVLLGTVARADVTGKITLDGQPPEMKIIDMSAVKECAARHKKPLREQTVIVDANRGLKNVVVAIRLDEGQQIAGAIPAGQAVLDQQGCMYVPHVLAMMVGQDLICKNSDDFLHNVHSEAQDNGNFNQGMPNANDGVKVQPQPKVPEIFHVKCDVHPWMSAWVAVFDSPYFAVSQTDGSFNIKNVPDGQYTFTAWHEKFGTLEQQVNVVNGTAKLDFTFKADATPAAP